MRLPGMRYRILHHQSRSHYGLQVADYCCWATFRKWQRGESAWYDRIKSALRSGLKVFRAESQPDYQKAAPEKMTPLTIPSPERAPLALLSSGGGLWVPSRARHGHGGLGRAMCQWREPGSRSGASHHTGTGK